MVEFLLYILLQLKVTGFVTTTTNQPPLVTLDIYEPSPDAVTIDNVPAFIWHRGCTPTAVGMLLAYWDVQGYDVLPTVDYAMFQPQTNAAIASAGHYEDYAKPIDRDAILPDKSEPPAGDEHTDDSIADCLLTSRSANNLPYGYTFTYRIPYCLEQYTNTDTITGTVTYCQNNCRDFIEGELLAGRPVLLTIWTGQNVHSVIAVGIDVDHYYALNTWSIQPVWYPYSECGGASWCVLEAFALQVESSEMVMPVELEKTFLPVVGKY